MSVAGSVAVSVGLPVVAEIVRSGFVEGHHYGSIVALAADGSVDWSVGEVDVPAFVVVGRRDVLTPPLFARQMVENLPDAELHVLPQAGPQLMQERPDDIARLIRDLAGRTEGAAGTRASTGP